MNENLYGEVSSYLKRSLSGTQAREIRPLNEAWQFHAGDAPEAWSMVFDDSAWRSVEIPHDYSIEGEFLSGHPANGFVQSGVLWYRKRFSLCNGSNRGKVYLLFDGVAMNSQVWINGRFLGQHPYAFTPFWYDITPFIRTGEQDENVIAVKADNSLQPFTRSYTGAGIFRNVWLISTGSLHIEQWGVTTEIKDLQADAVEVAVNTSVCVDRYPETVWNAFVWQGCGMENNNEITKTCTLVTSILDIQGNLTAEMQDTCTMPQFSRHVFYQKIRITSPRLWSPENPNLYTIHSKLYIDQQMVDDVVTPLGIRTIAYDARNGFLLNGRSIKFKGVCLHQDSGIYGAAVPVKAWTVKLQIMKEMGCNAVRTAHHPFPEEFYHICDYLGIMVMDEAFDEWKMGWDRGYMDQPYGKNTYGYYLYFEQWHDSDLRAMLRRDRNHPSVVIWSVGNEIPELYFKEGIPLLKRLVEICKEEDGERPVTVAAEGNHLLPIFEGIMDQVDIPGYNYVNSREKEAYYSRIHAQHPQWLLLGAETAYEPEHWQAARDNAYVAGQFLWVGYDYLGEGADLLGEDGMLGTTFDIAALAGSSDPMKKKALRRGWAFGAVDITDTPRGEYFYRQSIWSSQPVVHLAVKWEHADLSEMWNYYGAESHWNWNAGSKKTVYCFTNCEKVELYLNDILVGVRENDRKDPFAMEWEIGYVPGTLKAVGYNGGTVVCGHKLTTAGKPAALELEKDCSCLDQDGREDVHVAIRIVDEQGLLVPDSAHRVSVSVNGCGKLLGVISGDLTSSESYRSHSCNAYKGRCMAVVQATRDAGAAEIVVECAGLPSARLTLMSE